jgi:hypothetical protein
MCLVIYVASLTRKQSGVYLLDTRIKEKGGDVVIQQVEDATLQEM